MKNSERTDLHQRNQELEVILGELEQLMGGIGEDKEFTSQHPIIFIVGCARSGTTLVLQYLATLGEFCYPSNLLSRFYYAPYLGALIQKMLYDLDDKKELLRYYEDVPNYTSRLGKTKGILSPHEFWYYWRRFFKFGEIQKLSNAEIAAVNWQKFANGLYAIQHVNSKPIVLKGMILNWHLSDLADKIPNAHFIHVKRDIVNNAQSLLQARNDFFGSYNSWYSFKPPEYREISKKNYVEQVVDQVSFTNLAIEKGVSSLDANRLLTIDYDTFCRAPAASLKGFLLNMGIALDKGKQALQFTPSNKKALKENDWEQLNDYVMRQYDSN